MLNYQRVGIPFREGVRITSSKHRCNEAPDATTAVNSFLIGYLWNKDIREHDQQKYRLLYSIPIQRRRLPNCYPSCVHSRELWAIELSHHLDEQGLYTASVILFHDRRHLRRLHAEWNIMKHHEMAQVAAQIQSPSCGTNHDTFTLGPRDLLAEFGHVEECRCPATQRPRTDSNSRQNQAGEFIAKLLQWL